MRPGPDPHLETPRLRLRPLAPDDLHAFHALCGEPSVRRFLFDDRSVTLDEARGFLEAGAVNFSRRGWGLWCMEADAAPAPAGFVGFLSSEAGLPDLIYAIHPAHQGAGLATEAARAVLDHVFALAEERVQASVDEPNVASVRVLEKLGMRLVRRSPGAAGDLLHYELSRPSS